MKHLFTVLILLFYFGYKNAYTQTSITAGGIITEDFSIGNQENAILPLFWKVDKISTVRTVGNYALARDTTEIIGGNNMGVGSPGGIYNFGAGDAASANDRAIGWLSANNETESGNLYTFIKNTGSENIYNFSISYAVEKYKKGSNNSGFTIQLYYSEDGIIWHSAGNEFKTDFPSDGIDNNGFSNAPGVSVHITDILLDIPLGIGDSLYLAWNYSVTSGVSTNFAQALAIDDVVIKANVAPPSLDAAIIECLAPATNCHLTANEIVSVKIKNEGTDTINEVVLSYSIDGGLNYSTPELYTGQILPGSEIIYTFTATADFSNSGIYNCYFSVFLNGDEYSGNDTIQSYITHVPSISSYPYYEDFESFNGWTSPGNIWQNGMPMQQGISSAKSGTYVWMTGVNSNYTNNIEEFLLSPCYDFSNLVDPQFSVWLNINIIDEGNDAMILEYTKDGGNSWHKVMGGNNFYNYTYTQGLLPSPKWSGNTNGWHFFETSLIDLAGESNVRLRFRFLSDATINGEGIAIDDVTIRDPYLNDIAINNIITPVNGCGLSSTSTISVEILNIGLDTIFYLPVTYSINGGTTFISDEIINDTILPSDTLAYSFTTTANLSTPGTYHCIVKHNLIGDENPTNDMASKIISSIPYISTYPFEEDFEVPFTGWGSTSFSGINQWEIGTPNQAALNSSFSGVNSWMTRLSYNYNNNSISYLTSPCYDFTNLSEPYFSTMLNIRTENGYDAMVMETSTDGGITWAKVTGDVNFYNNNSSLGSTLPPKWSGNNNGWQKYETSLPWLANETNVRFRFVFSSNASINDEGISIDDVIVRDKLNNDLAVIDWVSPVDGCGLSASESVSIEIANLGKNSQSGFNLGYSMNGGTYTFETFTGTINPGDTITFIFSATADFSIPTNYSCIAIVNLSTDENAANDAYLSNVMSIPNITTYPYFQDFEMGSAGWTSGAISGNNQWQLGMPQQPSINFAKSGFNAWMTGLNNNYENNSDVYLESPCLDFTNLTDPQISVWLNIKITDEGNDAMVLEQSTDDGQTWAKVTGDAGFYNYTDSGGDIIPPNWSGTTSGWKEFKSALSGLAGLSNVRLRFRFLSNSSNIDEGIAIDDIMIHDPFTNDLAVLEWISPITECNMTSNEDIVIKIANLGTIPQSNFDLFFSTNGGITFSQPATYTGTLNAGDTVIFTFPHTADFSIPGEYNCIAMVNLATEENPNNDYVFAKVYAIPTLNNFPYFDDFEAQFSGWTSIALQGTNQWEKGTPFQNTLNTPHSGSQVYMTKLYSNYTNNSNSVLLSPCLNMSMLTNPHISVWLNMKTEPGYDAMIIEKSTNGGLSWSKLDGDAGFYNNSSPNGPINVPPKWSGTTNGWTNFVTSAPDLINQNNVRLRFRFASDDTGNDEGISIDDILIYEPTGNDLGVTAILLPTNSICGSISDSIKIEITNFGFNTQTHIPVKIEIITPITTMITIYDTIVTNLSPGESQVYFIDTINTLGAGTYYIFAETELESDTINYFNNLASGSFNIKYPLTIPYVENFELPNSDWTGTNFSIGQSHGSSTKVLYAELSSSNMQANAYSTKIGPLTQQSRLKFDYRIVDPLGNPYNMQTGDVFQINISNDCFSSNYTLIEVNDGNHITSNTKHNLEFDLSAFSGDDIFLNFNFTSSGLDFYVDIDNIIIANAPVVYLGNDTSLCTGSIELFANNAPQNTYYYWQELSLPDTISTAQSLLVNQTGYYKVTVDNGFGMTVSDSIEVSINPLPVFDLGPNFSICSGLPANIVASGGIYYLWNTGDTTASISVYPTTTTNYSVTVTDYNGCMATDDINISVYQLPIVNLGNDHTLCGNGSTILNAGANFTSYLWSTGDTTQTINVDSTGLGYGSFIFSVTVTDSNGCLGDDSINIIFDPCTGINNIKDLMFEIYPNPTKGTINIRVVDTAAKEALHILLFNSQAKLISSYKFDNIYQGFNKEINLQHLSQGVYFIKLITNKEIQTKKIIIH